LNWSATYGKRAAAFKRLVNSEDAVFRVKVLAIVTETTRYLTMRFLSFSSGRRDPNKPPPLLDTVNDDFSPIVTVLQYLASLLVKGEGRLVLLHREYETTQQWEMSCGTQVRYFRRLIMVAAGWIKRRHLDSVKQPPFSTSAPSLKSNLFFTESLTTCFS
jgi:hypothetical protein